MSRRQQSDPVALAIAKAALVAHGLTPNEVASTANPEGDFAVAHSVEQVKRHLAAGLTQTESAMRVTVTCDMCDNPDMRHYIVATMRGGSR